MLAQTIVTVITDFIVFVLPLPTLWTLRLPTGQRIVLLLLFSMGAAVVIAGCMRAYWVHHVVDDTYDVTWEGWELWIWTAVEINVGIIAGCVPMLKPLVYPSSTRERESLYGKRRGERHNVAPESFGESAHSRSRSNKADDIEGGVFRIDSWHLGGFPPALGRPSHVVLSMSAKDVCDEHEIHSCRDST